MRNYIYKTLIAVIALIVVFEFTIGKTLNKITSQTDILLTKEGRKEMVNSIKIEMEKAMKKATQSGGQAAFPDTTANAAAAGTQTTQAANPSAGQGVGIFGDAEAVKALGEASVKVAKEADNIVDKNVDKAATYPADLLKKTGAAAAARRQQSLCHRDSKPRRRRRLRRRGSRRS